MFYIFAPTNDDNHEKCCFCFNWIYEENIRNIYCGSIFLTMSDWVIDCYLMPREQFFNYIVTRIIYHFGQEPGICGFSMLAPLDNLPLWPVKPAMCGFLILPSVDF